MLRGSKYYGSGRLAQEIRIIPQGGYGAAPPPKKGSKNPPKTVIKWQKTLPSAFLDSIFRGGGGV